MQADFSEQVLRQVLGMQSTQPQGFQSSRLRDHLPSELEKLLSDIEAFESNQVYVLLMDEYKRSKEMLVDTVIDTTPKDIADFVAREQSMGALKSYREFLLWVKNLKEETKQTIQQKKQKDEKAVVTE